MTSVTQRISLVKQPRGGFLPVKLFSEEKLSDGKELFSQENVSPNLVGLCVDYLSRFMIGSDKEQAFEISLLGASLAGATSMAVRSPWGTPSAPPAPACWSRCWAP